MSRTIPSLAIAALAWIPSPEASAGEPVPEGATLSVRADREEYVLGEEVVLRLTLRNGGTRPFTISPMVWQRFASRDELVTLTLADAEGREAWDPFPERQGGGGPCPPDLTLKPGEEWTEDLDLWRYRIPERPGTWALRVARHFGWGEGPGRDQPVAEGKIRFREPRPDEVRTVVDALLAGEGRAKAYSAAYGAYVPLLEEAAAAGNPDAVQGLLLNRDLGATRALLRLFASKHRAVAAAAGRALLERISVEVPPELKDHRYLVLHPETGVDRTALAPFWRPEFAAEALEAARAFLMAEGDPPAGAAALVLRLLGTPADARYVVEGFENAARSFDRRAGEDVFSFERRTTRVEADHEELGRAARVMVLRGAPIPASPESTGESLFWLETHWLRPVPRHEARQEILRRLATHPRALVRRGVAWVCRPPERAPPAGLLEALRKDPDERVRKAAGADR